MDFKEIYFGTTVICWGQLTVCSKHLFQGCLLSWLCIALSLVSWREQLSNVLLTALWFCRSRLLCSVTFDYFLHLHLLLHFPCPFHFPSQAHSTKWGTPIYKPYRYVPPQRVSFSSVSSLKYGIDFAILVWNRVYIPPVWSGMPFLE